MNNLTQASKEFDTKSENVKTAGSEGPAIVRSSADQAIAAILGEKQTFLERISDKLNPILVKETRQAFSSRVFLFSFMTMLLICWLVSLFGSIIAGEKLQYAAYATSFFTMYASVLMFACFIVVPFIAFTSLQSERQEATFDVLNITTLGARRIVYGKMWNAVVQISIYFIAIAPFVAFTSLLQGFRLQNVVWIMMVLFAIAVTLSSIGILLSSLAEKRFFQTLNTIVFIAGVLILTCYLVFMRDEYYGQNTMLYLIASWQVTEEIWVRWVGVGISILFAFLYSWCFLEIAVARITFVSDNRSTAVRVSFMTLLVAICGVTIGVAFIPGTPGELFLTLFILAGCHIVVASWFATTEPLKLSRRLHNQVGKHSIYKLLGIVFAPGASRGMIYTLAMLAIYVGSAVITISIASSYATKYGGYYGYGPSESYRLLQQVGGISSFIIIYAAIGLHLSVWFRKISSMAHSGHIRMLSLIIYASLAIVPFFINYVLFYQSYDVLQYNVSFLFNPLSTMTALATGGSAYIKSDMILVLLFMVAGLLLLTNIPSILRGIAELFAKPQRSRLTVESLGNSIPAEVADHTPKTS